jgi:hypothetical protein
VKAAKPGLFGQVTHSTFGIRDGNIILAASPNLVRAIRDNKARGIVFVLPPIGFYRWSGLEYRRYEPVVPTATIRVSSKDLLEPIGEL